MTTDTLYGGGGSRNDVRMAENQDALFPPMAMPSADREMRRAINHMMRHGMERNAAAWVVCSVIASVRGQLASAGITNTQWLREMWMIAKAITATGSQESGYEDDAGGRE